MQHNRGFIYKKYRKAAGLTQEATAEYLGKDVRTVQGYESGAFAVSDSVAVDMADLYNNERLLIEHIQQGVAGKRALGDGAIQEGVLASAVHLLDALNEFDSYRPALLKIAKDNVITEDEIPIRDEIAEKLEIILHGVLSVKFAK